VLSFNIIANHKFSGGLEVKKNGEKKKQPWLCAVDDSLFCSISARPE
jgi:hypothetical protein